MIIFVADVHTQPVCDEESSEHFQEYPPQDCQSRDTDGGQRYGRGEGHDRDKRGEQESKRSFSTSYKADGYLHAFDKFNFLRYRI